MVHKVRAYVWRQRDGKYELLVYCEPDHPEAGIQIPGGTVDEGEELISALKREMFEECGRDFALEWHHVESYEFTHPITGKTQIENIFTALLKEQSPDEWEHLVTGGGEDDGIRFAYSWLSVYAASEKLWPWMSAPLENVLKKLENAVRNKI